MTVSVHENAYRQLCEAPEVKIMQVILVTTVIGNGIDDPLRPVDRYYDMDGMLIAEKDSLK